MRIGQDRGRDTLTLVVATNGIPVGTVVKQDAVASGLRFYIKVTGTVSATVPVVLTIDDVPQERSSCIITIADANGSSTKTYPINNGKITATYPAGTIAQNHVLTGVIF